MSDIEVLTADLTSADQSRTSKGAAYGQIVRRPVPARARPVRLNAHAASKSGGAWPRHGWKANEAWHILSPMMAPFAAT